MTNLNEVKITSVKDIETAQERQYKLSAKEFGSSSLRVRDEEIADLRAYAEQLERERKLFLTDEQISDKINQHFNYGAVYGSDKAQHYASFIEIRNFVRDVLGQSLQFTDKEMHEEIQSRSETINELNKMTKFDSSTSLEDIINKVMNKDNQNDKRMD